MESNTIYSVYTKFLNLDPNTHIFGLGVLSGVVISHSNLLSILIGILVGYQIKIIKTNKEIKQQEEQKKNEEEQKKEEKVVIVKGWFS